PAADRPCHAQDDRRAIGSGGAGKVARNTGPDRDRVCGAAGGCGAAAAQTLQALFPAATAERYSDPGWLVGYLGCIERIGDAVLVGRQIEITLGHQPVAQDDVDGVVAAHAAARRIVAMADETIEPGEQIVLENDAVRPEVGRGGGSVHTDFPG